MAPIQPKHARRGLAYRTTISSSSSSPSSSVSTKTITKHQPSLLHLRLRRLAGFKKPHRRSCNRASNVPTISTLPLELSYLVFDHLMDVPRIITISAKSPRLLSTDSTLGPLFPIFQTSKHIQDEIRTYVSKWFGCGGVVPAHLYKSRVFGLLNLERTTFILHFRDRNGEKVIRRHASECVTRELIRTLEVRQEAMWDVGDWQADVNLEILDLWRDEEIWGEAEAMALPGHGGMRCGEYLLWPQKGDERPFRKRKPGNKLGLVVT